jgi:DNA-binding NtrC family response regulator
MDLNMNGHSEASTDYIEEFARFVRTATSKQPESPDSHTLKAWLDLAEAYRITQALRECEGNRSAAARLLGIGRRTLYAKMDKLGITATWRMS